MTEKIDVNWERVRKLAEKVVLQIDAGPTTEKFIACLLAGMWLADGAQPGAGPGVIADLMADITGNLLLEYRENRLPVTFKRGN